MTLNNNESVTCRAQGTVIHSANYAGNTAQVKLWKAAHHVVVACFEWVYVGTPQHHSDHKLTPLGLVPVLLTPNHQFIPYRDAVKYK